MTLSWWPPPIIIHHPKPNGVIESLEPVSFLDVERSTVPELTPTLSAGTLTIERMRKGAARLAGKEPDPE